MLTQPLEDVFLFQKCKKMNAFERLLPDLLMKPFSSRCIIPVKILLGVDMKVIVATDSFKGSLSSLEAGHAVRDGIIAACPDVSVTVLPLADGGEGTIDAIAPYVGGSVRRLNVTGPLGSPVEASYIYDPSTATAYIEMAKASGLTLVSPSSLDPMHATSYGTGELMADAIKAGASSLVICIGGSATNDAGAGMLQALGAKLTSENGSDIPFGVAGLSYLSSVDLSALPRGISVTVASDVTNPLCGPDGASHVYGPQKGADPKTAEMMDQLLMSFAKLTGFDPFEPGTGAAGGMSFALKNFLGATLKSGADIVNELTGAESLIRDCDIVITGEGRMDSQTVNGKGPYKILQLAQKYGKPVIGITGVLGDGYEKCLKAGFSRIVPLFNPTMEREAARASVKETVRRLFETESFV